MKTFCEEAFRNWHYSNTVSGDYWLWFLRRCRSLLLLWPSRMDRTAFMADVCLELQRTPNLGIIPKLKYMATSLVDFAKKKLRFRSEMLEIKRVQADWCHIPVVYAPGKPSVSTCEANVSIAMRQAA
jgi:hypothetical protein